MNDDEKHSYEKVRAKLIEKIDRSNNISYLQDFFNKVQKNGENVEDYSMALKKAFNKAFKASNSEDASKALLGRFRTGLVPEIQSIMCTTEPKSYEEAVEMASKIEKSLELKFNKLSINSVEKHNNYENYKNYDKKPYSRSRPRTMRRSPTPFNRNSTDRKFDRSRSNSSSSRASSPQRNVCYNCRKPGHIAKYCKSRVNTNNFGHFKRNDKLLN